MSAFIAKLDKPTYANVRFLKQALQIHSDEELLKFMALTAAAEVHSQLKQVEASNAEAALPDTEKDEQEEVDA